MGDELCPMQHLGGEAERPQQRRAQASSSSEPIKKRSRKTKLVPPGKLGEHCFNDKNVLRWFQFIAERHRVCVLLRRALLLLVCRLVHRFALTAHRVESLILYVCP